MRLLGTIVLGVLCVAIALYALAAYSMLPLGTGLPPAMKLNFISHRAAVYTHIFAAAAALLLGPLQFSAALRRRFTRLHRVSGRLYLMGVLLGGMGGLQLSFLAQGGLVAKVGFCCLATLWLYTGMRAFLAIRNGNVAEHRQWMVRNFSLTFAAVTLRIYLPSAGLLGIPFDVSYPVIAWACWVPNLAVAEWCFNRLGASTSVPLRGTA